MALLHPRKLITVCYRTMLLRNLVTVTLRLAVFSFLIVQGVKRNVLSKRAPSSSLDLLTVNLSIVCADVVDRTLSLIDKSQGHMPPLHPSKGDSCMWQVKTRTIYQCDCQIQNSRA